MKNKPNYRKRGAAVFPSEQGFTIIEVLIAIAILGIGILGVASMQISATNGNASARKVTTNVTYAANGVEGLLQESLKYEQYKESPLLNTPLVTPSMQNDFIDNDQDGQVDENGETGYITGQWTVSEDEAVNHTKTVRYTINNNGPRGSKSVTLNLIIPEII